MKITTITLFLLIALLLAGCQSSIPSFQSHHKANTPPVAPTPQATSTILLDTPTPPSPAIRFSSVLTLPTQINLSPDTISTLKMPAVSWAVADSGFIYWVEYQQHNQIFRMPLNGGEISVVTTSNYPDGFLLHTRLRRTGNWLIFTDSEVDATVPPYTLRAINLQDGSEQMLIDSRKGEFGLPDLEVDNQGRVVWTTAASRNSSCTETVLEIYDLHSKQKRRLDEACVEEVNYMWVLPSISGNFIALERDFFTDNLQGGENNIYLYDLQNDTFIALTSDGQSSTPYLSGEWLVWSNAHRFEFPKQSSIFNLKTGEQQIVDLGLNGPNIANERWVYWEVGFASAIYVYDLATQKFFFVAGANSGESLASVDLNDNIITWWRSLTVENAVLDGQIEWRVLQ